MKRTKLIYFFILCELVVLNVIYVRYWPMWLLIIFVCFGILMFAKGFVQKRFVKMEVFESKDSVNIRDNYALNIRISNTFFLPVTGAKLKLKVKEVDSDVFTKRTIEFDIRERKHTDIELTVDTGHIGMVRVVVVGLYIFDDIRLFKHKINCKKGQYDVCVMPKLLENLGLPVSSNDFLESDTFEENRPGDDPGEVFGIREYVPGDKINRIHWKLSAKSNDTIVKEYSKPEAMVPLVVLDRRSCEFEENDRLLETLFSVIHSLVSMGKSAIVCYMGAEGVKDTHISGFEDVYDGIRNVIAGKVSEDCEVLKATIEELSGNVPQDIYWITNEVEEEYRILLEEMKNVSFYIFALSGNDEIINIKEWIIDEK